MTAALAYARAFVRDSSSARDHRSMSWMNGHREAGLQTSSACSAHTVTVADRRTEGASGMSERIGIGGRGHGDSRDGGFTLVEAIVASVILLVAGTAVVIALVSTGNWYASANARAQATSLASQQLAWVRSRSYDDITLGPSTTGAQDSLEVGPSIPATQSVETSIGIFTVATSISSTVDTSTQIPMKLIQVSVSAPSLASPVTLWGYAASPDSTASAGSAVPVNVTLSGASLSGVPVELLDTGDPNLQTVDYWALSGSNNVAAFSGVMPGQYWLTVAPTYTAVHATTFPQRVIIAPGVSSNLSLTVATTAAGAEACLRVGAYRGFGCTLNGGSVTPPTPYNPAAGLTIYAQPQFDETYPGGLSEYPQVAEYPQSSNLVYSGVVNSYGVAVISVPWTLSSIQQGHEWWHIWYTTTTTSGPKTQSGDYYAAGSWISPAGTGSNGLPNLAVPDLLGTTIVQFPPVTGTW